MAHKTNTHKEPPGPWLPSALQAGGCTPILSGGVLPHQELKMIGHQSRLLRNPKPLSLIRVKLQPLLSIKTVSIL